MKHHHVYIYDTEDGCQINLSYHKIMTDLQTVLAPPKPPKDTKTDLMTEIFGKHVALGYKELKKTVGIGETTNKANKKGRFLRRNLLTTDAEQREKERSDRRQPVKKAI